MEHESFEKLVQAVRLSFFRLSALGDALHEEEGISTSMRGVLEGIYRNGPQSVPQMARARPVSRQFIQQIVNALLEKGLVELGPNPAHKRSDLVALTDQGRHLFETVRAREKKLVETHLGDLSEEEAAAASNILSRLTENLGALQSTFEGET